MLSETGRCRQWVREAETRDGRAQNWESRNHGCCPGGERVGTARFRGCPLKWSCFSQVSGDQGLLGSRGVRGRG